MGRAAWQLFAWTLCVASSSGCFVSSLHPIYEDKSIVFDEALVGTWENRESEITIVVSRAEWRSYLIAFTDRFATTEFTGHLTRIGNARFLNLLPAGGLEKPVFVIATNGFVQIDTQGNGLRARGLDYDVVLRRASAGKLGIAGATDVKQNVLLTSSSAKLRAWLTASLKDEALWSEWTTFTRSTP